MAVKGTSTVTLTRVVDGTNGTNGTNGVSVTKMDQYYLATTASSGVTTSTSGWTTTFQAITSSKRYLWGYQKYTYSNSTTTTTTPAIIGVYGDTGGAGATGKGVSSVTTYFLVNSSNSGVTTSTSGWTTTLQTTSETNRYLWQYEKYQYTDNTSTNTTPRIVSTHGASGKDAITISITPEWSGSTCTLTANVFMGGRQLSDTEILALGCLKWYEGTTFISNGKQLTRTVSTKQVVECRLESGGGGLMPEYIILADGSLAVKGRNLLYQSCPLVIGNWNNNGTPCVMDSETLYDGKPTLKTVLGGGIRYYPIPRTTHSENVEDWLPMVPDQTYTYSMCLKAEGTVAHGSQVPLHWHFKNSNGEAIQSPTVISNGGTITVGEWSIIWTKFRSNHKWMRPFIYTGQNPAVTVNIAWIKLEYGDEMTEPSAAPEDEEVTT